MAQVVLVKDINPDISGSNPDNFIEFDDQLYFTADDGEHGRELWVSDGTSTGTQLLLNINPEYSYYYDDYLNINSNPDNFIEFDDQLYFTADDGEHGRELWVSDGTATGTQLLLDINPRIIDYGHFEAPYPFSSNPDNFMEFDDKLYFTADDGEHGNELWVSDGTPTGTKLLLDINPGISGSYPQNFTESNDKLYFTAYDDENGLELWVSDGTSTGTQILLDIDPGIGNYGGSYPYNLIQFDGKLYFTANDGENGHELWVSDGTPTGTQLLLDLNPGISSSLPSDFIESDGKLYFTANDGENGYELWVSDGTPTGTQLLLDINPGMSDSNPSDFIEFDDKLYFTADDGENGRELWVSDGTTAGTKSLVDINLGNGSLIVVDDELFLNANDPITGNELYKLTFDDSDADITYITGTNSPDRLVGSDGVDQITGLSGNDVLGGKAGNDILHGGKGNDALFGADGHDTLTGDDGNDILRGQSGKDVLNGSDGNDTLFGGNQFDHLSGGDGDDVLDDIQGITIYNGGTGSDIFVIHNDAQADWIQDFEPGIDKVRLADGITFGQLEITGHVNSFLSFQGEQIGVLLGVSPNDLNATMVQAVFLTNL